MSLRNSGRVFNLICFFLSNTRLCMALESLQEYLVDAGVTQGSIFGHTLFLLFSNDPLDDIICNIAIYADYTTF